MASRNERKRRARERHAALVDAVAQAERLAWEQAIERQRLVVQRETYVSYDALPKSSNGPIVERSGAIVKGKFERREPATVEPLRHDGNDSGYGQLRKRWTK